MKVVILAGGKGERLKPITNIMPKALTPINGIPIIKRQIDNLANLGLEEVFVLTGYRSEMTSTYLSSVYSGSKVKVKCIDTPENFSPAERLLDAKKEIGPNFLLLYCDNLVNDLDSIAKVMKSNAPITFLVEKREEGNVSIKPKVSYEQLRSQEFQYVELGFMKIHSNSFFESLEELKSLQETLKNFTHKHECAAVVTVNSLQSISTILRFNSLRIKRQTILLDRDGVLNEKMPHREYLARIEDYSPIEENILTLVKLYSHSTDFIIITNQPGIATKEVDSKFLDFLHSKMIVELLLKGLSIIGIYVCPHHWEENCECRKPKPGMIKQAIRDYELGPESLVYIGDEEKDLYAAKAAGVQGVRISRNVGADSFPSIAEAHNYIQKIVSKDFI